MRKLATKEALMRMDLTSEGLFRALMVNTVPMWIGSSLYIFLLLWELYVVGRLGTEYIAATAIAEASIMFFWTAIAAISNISIAIVGNLSGKKDLDQLKEVVLGLIYFCFGASLFLAFVGSFFAEDILSALGAKDTIIRIATPYLKTVMIGGIVAFPLYAIISILRAVGEIVIPATIVYGSIILNGCLLFPLFMDFSFFVNLGLIWVALAYTISHGAGTFVALFFLFSGRSSIGGGISKSLRWSLPQIRAIKEMASLAGFNTAEMLLANIVSLIIVRFVSEWGTYALAAYEIGQRLFMASMLWGFDIATVSNILVANNLGAGQLGRAEKSAWISCLMNVLIMGGAGLIIWLYPESMVSIFDKKREVIEIGKDYLRITILGWPFVAAWTILRRSFIGAKDVLTPFLISLLTMFGIELPLAFFLAKTPIGIRGIWWAIFVTYLLQGLTSSFLFKTGRWKRT